MGELCKWEPVVLLIFDEYLKILLDLLVDSFCLSVGLQVEGRGRVLSDIEHTIEFLHELGDELWSLVRDDYLGHSMSSIYMVSENLGPSFGGEFNVACDGDDGFQKSIYNDEKGVVSVRCW